MLNIEKALAEIERLSESIVPIETGGKLRSLIGNVRKDKDGNSKEFGFLQKLRDEKSAWVSIFNIRERGLVFLMAPPRAKPPLELMADLERRIRREIDRTQEVHCGSKIGILVGSRGR